MVNTAAYDFATFTPATPIRLEAGQRYWLELRSVNTPVNAMWGTYQNTAPSGIFTFITYVYTSNGGTAWAPSALHSEIVLDADVAPPIIVPTPVPTNTPSNPVIQLPSVSDANCPYGLPPGGVQGRILADTYAFYDPAYGATTDLLIEGGSAWWIIDTRNGFYKIWIHCAGQPLWIPMSNVSPNYDEVWRGGGASGPMRR